MSKKIDPSVLEFINRLVPEHSRTSCSDEHITNSLYIEGLSDHKTYRAVKGRCSRCSLLAIAEEPTIVLPERYTSDGYTLLNFIN
jgi:hypothetical protein